MTLLLVFVTGALACYTLIQRRAARATAAQLYAVWNDVNHLRGLLGIQAKMLGHRDHLLDEAGLALAGAREVLAAHIDASLAGDTSVIEHESEKSS